MRRVRKRRATARLTCTLSISVRSAEGSPPPPRISCWAPPAASLRSRGRKISLRIGLVLRQRVAEGAKFVRRLLYSPQCRIGTQIHLRAPRVGELRDEADVGERRRIAMTECAGFRRAQHRLERRKPGFNPVDLPGQRFALAGAQARQAMP